jgi:serine/threonine-protein kinase
MLAEYVTDGDLRARFHQEVKISSQMEHPSIVKMYASFEENGNLYLVMEYVEGETIEQYVRQRGPIEEGEAIRLLCAVLSALGYAHQKGFVHRDIKPSNIMIRSNGSVCLLDFGIAKDMNSNGLTIGQATIGTDGYMSPEQADGYNIDHRSDIYSLGCVFFYMLTGHHAIEKRSNDHETRIAIIQNDFPRAADYNPAISANTQNILNKATHKSMMQRFQSCREFELELNNKRTVIMDSNNSISVGRGDCDIIIPNPKVSSHHADIRIETQSGHTRYLFQDRSTNGTVIDGRKVHNGEIEIYPHAHPVILLAGTAELKWDTVEETFRKKKKFDVAVQPPSPGQPISPQFGMKAPDEAFCSSCGAIIKKEAEICLKCGVKQKRAFGNTMEVNVNWLTLLILSIFFGEFGIDRFYVGKIGTGILKLVTLGGCGIWWLIDLIIIVCGKFTDSNGNVITKDA